MTIMKKFTDFLFSTKTTVYLLLILAIAIGSATFIEQTYDTDTAKHLVYNAKWFEFLFVLLSLNFLGNISKYNLFSKRKAAGFIFHFAFLIMILGAAITRYTGYTGSMSIREGDSSNIIFTADPYLKVMSSDNNVFERPMAMTQWGSNDFKGSIQTKDVGEIKIEFRDFIKNAVDQVNENVEGGKNVIEVVITGSNGRESVFVTDGDVIDLGMFALSYNNAQNPNAIQFFDQDGSVFMTTPFPIGRTKMPEMATDSVPINTPVAIKEKCMHQFEGGLFVIKKAYKKAKKTLIAGTENEKPSGVNALGLNVTIKGKKHEIQVMGGSSFLSNYQDFDLDGYHLKAAYGLSEMKVPFTIKLNKFILERYAGSMSPSSFTSEVSLNDPRNGKHFDTRIFMNNVLDYDGYRFFQSSYDPDEKGTILSVNHDFWGTWVSYVGYFLMGLGFFLTLFGKTSRFQILSIAIKHIRETRKATAIFILLSLLGINAQAQHNQNNHVSAEHADKLAHLVVQTFDGRFEPVHTLAYDVLHKISRKDNVDVEGVGTMNAMQVYLDMILNADFWKTQKLIYIREKSVQDVLGVSGGYAAFNDFFDANGQYKLKEFAETSFRKKQSEQNTFDKEIIKVDERANVCMMAFNGSMLRIFPLQDSPNNTWISWDDSLAVQQLTGSIRVLNEDLQLREFNVRSMMGIYLQEVYKATSTKDYSRADKILGYISGMQRQSGASNLIPSQKRIDREIQYNKANIFVFLRNVYSFLSLVMLALAFTEILRTKKNKVISLLLNICVGILALCFLYNTYGMILRWYLTGHAPWSTGYEALLLIAWGGTLAGFFFVRNSKITMAATTLLAFFVLMTASHSSYDPQLTNLQPVLKSYWLVIHVATLTISYSFLGLGFLLGMINLCIVLFQNKKNYQRLSMVITELTNINEMNLTIGLFLATVGTFLGGIWANESWGKYWGWDAKETWALVIVITYTIVIHIRLIPKMKTDYFFNVLSVLAYSSVLMTFFGVNYYLSKGMHSYAAGDTPVFPMWAWISIVSVFTLIAIAGFKNKAIKKLED